MKFRKGRHFECVCVCVCVCVVLWAWTPSPPPTGLLSPLYRNAPHPVSNCVLPYSCIFLSSYSPFVCLTLICSTIFLVFFLEVWPVFICVLGGVGHYVKLHTGKVRRGRSSGGSAEGIKGGKGERGKEKSQPPSGLPEVRAQAVLWPPFPLGNQPSVYKQSQAGLFSSTSTAHMQINEDSWSTLQLPPHPSSTQIHIHTSQTTQAPKHTLLKIQGSISS